MLAKNLFVLVVVGLVPACVKADDLEKAWAEQGRRFDFTAILEESAVSASVGAMGPARALTPAPKKKALAMPSPTRRCGGENKPVHPAARAMGLLGGSITALLGFAVGVVVVGSIVLPLLLAVVTYDYDSSFGDRLGKILAWPIALPIQGFKWGRKAGIEAAYSFAQNIRKAIEAQYKSKFP